MRLNAYNIDLTTVSDSYVYTGLTAHIPMTNPRCFPFTLWNASFLHSPGKCPIGPFGSNTIRRVIRTIIRCWPLTRALSEEERGLAESARGKQRFASNPGGIRRRKKHGDRRDVAGLTDPAEWSLLCNIYIS